IALGIPPVAFSSDGRRVALVADGKTVQVHEVATGKRLCQLQVLTETVQCVAFSADGQRIACAGGGKLNQLGLSDQLIQVCDATTGQLLGSGLGHTGPVQCLAFGPGQAGNWLASGGDDLTVRLWDLHAGDRSRGGRPGLFASYPARVDLRGHNQTVRGLAFSPDGRRLASVSGDENRHGGEVKVW